MPLLIRAMAPKFPLFTERNVVIFHNAFMVRRLSIEKKQPSDLLQSCDQPSDLVDFSSFPPREILCNLLALLPMNAF